QAFNGDYCILLQARDDTEATPRLQHSSLLRKRSPYMDRDGILRVKGRIDACSFVSDETKRPIILPKTHFVTDLIIDRFHRKYRHANHFTVMNEVRQSWLIEVEFIINSRPLTDVPVDREEDSPLTPNHLLLGSSCGAKPIASFDPSTEAIKNTWKTSQVYADTFWRKWVACYLPTLTKRTKWFDTVKPIKEGDVVLIVDETLPRGCWPKGRVVKATESKDGATRKVHVLTASGKIIERPAVKVAVIDVTAK
uniref:DUF5641 domain-containing protein n=1 Tax=Anopheles dirus TaxID=7168 RepID=A0A182NGH9_9DIPT